MRSFAERVTKLCTPRRVREKGRFLLKLFVNVSVGQERNGGLKRTNLCTFFKQERKKGGLYYAYMCTFLLRKREILVCVTQVTFVYVFVK